MDRVMVETYRYLRDHAKPISQRDAADLAKIRAPQPPSKALLKRVKRHQEGRPFLERPRPYVTSDETQYVRMQNDFFKSQMAQLCGTRTIKPDPEPIRKPQQSWVYVEPVQKQELYPEPKPFTFMSEEQAKSLRKDHLVALYRAGLHVDMIEVVELFGSFECFRERVDA
jgi:hypothetical protein